ncbi:MAG: flagellar biosynthesis protein FlhF [Planctomycetaceae bacterium]|nr:flagellar biosynthesis protein FlhF [Planctomycetaceae bacterium]
METKTYRVRSLADALQLIAAELGPEAAVLHTRRLQPSLWKWWDRSQWEVVAGTDPNLPDRFQQFLQEDAGFAAADSANDRSGMEDAPVRPAPRSAPLQQVTNRASVAVARDKSIWSEVMAELQRLGVSQETIELLGADLGLAMESFDTASAPQAWRPLVHECAKHLRFAGSLALPDGKCTRVALVGPTGVGKTTTIAKLAADFQLRSNHRVALITVDTFRVAAVEQLQTYAEIMDMPLCVVHNPQEMRTAVQQFANFDLVLIDTVGRSPRDQQRIETMNQTLRAADLDHLLLTVSASSDPRTLATAATAFQSQFADVATSLILTKVDECHSLAPVYPFLRDCSIPWRYWTNGQQVPDDLGVARPDVVAWFLGEIELSPDVPNGRSEPTRSSLARGIPA